MATYYIERWMGGSIWAPKKKLMSEQNLMQIIWDICNKPTFALFKGKEDKIEGAYKRLFEGGNPKGIRWLISRPIQGYELLDSDQMCDLICTFGYTAEKVNDFDPQRPEDEDTNGGDT